MDYSLRLLTSTEWCSPHSSFATYVQSVYWQEIQQARDAGICCDNMTTKMWVPGQK